MGFLSIHQFGHEIGNDSKVNCREMHSAERCCPVLSGADRWTLHNENIQPRELFYVMTLYQM
jgi:hypothetical protein